MVILISDGVGERDLGLVMVFCPPNQAKLETCDGLSILHQCDSSEPSVVAVRRYSNTPYSPWGTIHLLYLDIDTFPGGIISVQFLSAGCICASYFLSAGLMYFYHTK